MLRVYNRETDDAKIVIPSFDDLIKLRHGGRALDTHERKKMLGHYPGLIARLAEFATESSLSERRHPAPHGVDDRPPKPSHRADGGRMKIQGKAEEQPSSRTAQL